MTPTDERKTGRAGRVGEIWGSGNIGAGFRVGRVGDGSAGGSNLGLGELK